MPGWVNVFTAASAGVMVIFQDFSLFPNLSVAENIVMGAVPRRGPFTDYARLAAEAGWPESAVHFDYFKNETPLDQSTAFEIALTPATRRR